MPSDEGFKGWVAGVLDAIGEVEIYRRLPGLREGNLEAAYYNAVRFTGADRQAMEAIRSAYGGRLESAKGQGYVRLALGGDEAVRLLRDVCPHLLLKKAQAEACLELADSVRRFRRYVGGERRRVPEPEMRRREKLYRSVIELNGRRRNGNPRKGVERVEKCALADTGDGG